MVDAAGFSRDCSSDCRYAADEDLQLGLPCEKMMKPAGSFIRYASDLPAILTVPVNEADFTSPLRSVPQPPLLVL